MKPKDPAPNLEGGLARRPWSKPEIIEAVLLQRSQKATVNDGDEHVTTPVNTNLAGTS